MWRIFTILFIGIIFSSCSRDHETINDEPKESLITNIKIDLNESRNWINPNEIDFYFEYDNQGRLVKKRGGFLSVSGSTGFSGVFSKDIYTTIVYSNQNVTVENFSSSAEFIAPKDTKYYTLNSQNQILTKEIPNSNKYLSRVLNYKYSNNKLVEITTTFPNMPYDPSDPNDYIWTYLEKFSYDSNENLVKTELFNQENGVNVGEKVVRTFENYDTSLNPTAKFYLLDDYFYRSISKNNFRKYTETHYNSEGIVSSTEKTWTFNYDSHGNIILN